MVPAKATSSTTPFTPGIAGELAPATGSKHVHDVVERLLKPDPAQNLETAAKLALEMAQEFDLAADGLKGRERELAQRLAAQARALSLNVRAQASRLGRMAHAR